MLFYHEERREKSRQNESRGRPLVEVKKRRKGQIEEGREGMKGKDRERQHGERKRR